MLEPKITGKLLPPGMILFKSSNLLLNKQIVPSATPTAVRCLLELNDVIGLVCWYRHIVVFEKSFTSNPAPPGSKIKIVSSIMYGYPPAEIFAMMTANYIKKNYVNSYIKYFKGKGHCEDSILNPCAMIKELDKIIIKKWDWH